MAQYSLTIRGLGFAMAAMAVLLLVGGCGDDGSSKASTNAAGEITIQTGSLSKAQFVKQADAICEESISKVRTEFRAYLRRTESSQANPKAEAMKLIDTVIAPAYEKQIAEISSLGAPSGDEEKIAAIFNTLQQGLDEGRNQPLKFLSAASPFARASRLAVAYGFKICGGT